MVKLKFYLTLLTLLLVAQTKVLAQTIESKISGTWYCEEMNMSKISLYKKADGYWYAKITASDAKENIGKTIIERAQYNAKDNALYGTLVRPGNGMQVNATITLESNNKIKIVGKKWMITKTFYWILL